MVDFAALLYDIGLEHLKKNHTVWPWVSQLQASLVADDLMTRIPEIMRKLYMIWDKVLWNTSNGMHKVLGAEVCTFEDTGSCGPSLWLHWERWPQPLRHLEQRPRSLKALGAVASASEALRTVAPASEALGAVAPASEETGSSGPSHRGHWEQWPHPLRRPGAMAPVTEDTGSSGPSLWGDRE